MDVLDLHKANWGIKDEDQLKKKDNFVIELKTRKLSEMRSRKSSINPSNVEYIRRSRFNSITDEMKSKQEDPMLMNELVGLLGSDITFYECFKLTTEEFVKKSSLISLGCY